MPNLFSFVEAATSTLPPLLICSDLQKGLCGGPDGRPHEAPVLRRCRTLLAAWRAQPWPVAHLKRIARPSWFDPASESTEWVEEFRPLPGELTFEHALPSAYSSARFVEHMRNIMPTRSMLTGYSLDETILSTAIDGFHRGYHYQIIEDAVACKSTKSTAQYRDIVLQLLRAYSGRVRSDAILGIACQEKGNFKRGWNTHE